MVTSLPSRIMNYSVSSSSPTDELLTLGQIFSEVGDYASTILDREHLSLSRRCVTKLNKVVDELVSRKKILSAENLYDMPETAPNGADLKSLSVDELHSLYRCWPKRHNERRAEGRESWTFYYEGAIVQEIKTRKATDKGEQFKIDYCVTMYSNELSNMSDLFSRPVQIDNDKIYPDNNGVYTAEELNALISLYKDYRDIVEREILVEYVDYALDLLKKEYSVLSCLGLLSEIAELGRREIIRVPAWVFEKLAESVSRVSSAATDRDSELVLPILTVNVVRCDPALEKKAKRIVNRCYKAVFDGKVAVDKRIENLHTAVTCSDYVSCFSVRKSATLWNELTELILRSEESVSSKHIFQMLEIAKELKDYSTISVVSEEKLRQLLREWASAGCLMSQTYNKIAEFRF